MKECTLDVQEDRRSFLHNERRPCMEYKIAAVALAFILMVIVALMVLFTFESENGIKELRQEVELLKSSVEVLQKRIAAEQSNDLDSKNDTFPKKVTAQNSSDTKNHNLDYASDYETNDEYDNSYDEDNIYDLSPDVEYGEDYENYHLPTMPNNDLNTLKKLMTGGEFTKDAKDITNPPPRTKRSIIGYTQDGMPVNSESIEPKLRNVTLQYQPTTQTPSSYSYPFYQQLKMHQELEQTTLPSRTTYYRRSRIMNYENKLRPTAHKSSPKSGDFQNSEENSEVEFTVGNSQAGLGHTRHRQRRLELDERHVRTGRMRPLPTAHFSGDTSKYVLGQHDNFHGNGRLRHPQRTFVDWTESSWFYPLGMNNHFSLSDGILTIQDPGLYFIYAQIYYLDEHDINGFRVYRNESETLLQCTTMTHSVGKVMKANTCFTAAAEYLNENDRVSVGDLSESRFSLFEPGKSFFGVIKLGDVKIK